MFDFVKVITFSSRFVMGAKSGVTGNNTRRGRDASDNVRAQCDRSVREAPPTDGGGGGGTAD